MSPGVVLDASVILNLLGSGKVTTILGAIPGRRIVVEVTSGEVLRHPLEPKSDGDPLAPLVLAGLLELVTLEGAAVSRFFDLVGAEPPNDLDDGEAAALAVGESLGVRVALDERKGRRVASAVLPHVELACSGSIFADAAVSAALGADLADALFSSLVNARMRVLVEHDAWVRGVLGPRAALCPSLRRRPR